MVSETLTLQDLHRDLTLLLQKVSRIEINLEEIDEDFHRVKPGYLKKLGKIKEGKFHRFSNKKEFLNFLENGI